ncbi:MAG: hypothetical protein P8M80_08235 [Pirellulaceae bacterium]|nr:hypothetical protein [Pirellulaceae bacterium]
MVISVCVVTRRWPPPWNKRRDQAIYDGPRVFREGVTRFSTLDDTAIDSWGGALGMNLLAPEFSQQIVLETAFVDVFGTDPDRNAKGSQLGFGICYQLPISNAVIFRADAMHGLRSNEEDLTGFRVEFRHKF